MWLNENVLKFQIKATNMLVTIHKMCTNVKILMTFSVLIYHSYRFGIYGKMYLG